METIEYTYDTNCKGVKPSMFYRLCDLNGNKIIDGNLTDIAKYVGKPISKLPPYIKESRKRGRDYVKFQKSYFIMFLPLSTCIYTSKFNNNTYNIKIEEFSSKKPKIYIKRPHYYRVHRCSIVYNKNNIQNILDDKEIKTSIINKKDTVQIDMFRMNITLKYIYIVFNEDLDVVFTGTRHLYNSMVGTNGISERSFINGKNYRRTKINGKKHVMYRVSLNQLTRDLSKETKEYTYTLQGKTLHISLKDYYI